VSVVSSLSCAAIKCNLRQYPTHTHSLHTHSPIRLRLKQTKQTNTRPLHHHPSAFCRNEVQSTRNADQHTHWGWLKDEVSLWLQKSYRSVDLFLSVCVDLILPWCHIYNGCINSSRSLQFNTLKFLTCNQNILLKVIGLFKHFPNSFHYSLFHVPLFLFSYE